MRGTLRGGRVVETLATGSRRSSSPSRTWAFRPHFSRTPASGSPRCSVARCRCPRRSLAPHEPCTRRSSRVTSTSTDYRNRPGSPSRTPVLSFAPSWPTASSKRKDVDGSTDGLRGVHDARRTRVPRRACHAGSARGTRMAAAWRSVPSRAPFIVATRSARAARSARSSLSEMPSSSATSPGPMPEPTSSPTALALVPSASAWAASKAALASASRAMLRRTNAPRRYELLGAAWWLPPPRGSELPEPSSCCVVGNPCHESRA